MSGNVSVPVSTGQAHDFVLEALVTSAFCRPLPIGCVP